ncbi:hypothetical protein DK419_02270 [Methylobacterium terrae]|uniref:Uncharacterized protein n=1 Tax=Methylobacterium terrae TaxID=2202827 RepID=A0A2U8WJA7_9HYPH|nr:hypothetical protein DK419_02270 [Methylobacterium terrae]
MPNEATPETPPHPRGEPSVRSLPRPLNEGSALSPPAGRGETRGLPGNVVSAGAPGAGLTGLHTACVTSRGWRFISRL